MWRIFFGEFSLVDSLVGLLIRTKTQYIVATFFLLSCRESILCVNNACIIINVPMYLSKKPQWFFYLFHVRGSFKVPPVSLKDNFWTFFFNQHIRIGKQVRPAFCDLKIYTYKQISALEWLTHDKSTTLRYWH